MTNSHTPMLCVMMAALLLSADAMRRKKKKAIRHQQALRSEPPPTPSRPSIFQDGLVNFCFVEEGNSNDNQNTCPRWDSPIDQPQPMIETDYSSGAQVALPKAVAQRMTYYDLLRSVFPLHMRDISGPNDRGGTWRMYLSNVVATAPIPTTVGSPIHFVVVSKMLGSGGIDGVGNSALAVQSGEASGFDESFNSKKNKILAEINKQAQQTQQAPDTEGNVRTRKGLWIAVGGTDRQNSKPNRYAGYHTLLFQEPGFAGVLSAPTGWSPEDMLGYVPLHSFDAPEHYDDYVELLREIFKQYKDIRIDNFVAGRGCDFYYGFFNDLVKKKDGSLDDHVHVTNRAYSQNS